jgi:hypothetical protein
VALLTGREWGSRWEKGRLGWNFVIILPLNVRNSNMQGRYPTHRTSIPCQNLH